MFGIVLSILVLVFVVSAGYIFDFINKEPGVTKSGVTKVTTDRKSTRLNSSH